ncbi:MAG TPA: hypothetical protein VL625_09690 [Patescibacteria group bacterium]|nr:hypothetical protein [Patescibacteria group bacterium]
MTLPDWLFFIPLLIAIFVGLFWEFGPGKFVIEKVPKSFLGPFILFCAYAWWRFYIDPQHRRETPGKFSLIAEIAWISLGASISIFAIYEWLNKSKNPVAPVSALEQPLIDCEVTFLADTRPFVPALNGDGYRPHIVVGDPNQREPILGTRTTEVMCADGFKRRHTSDKWVNEEYLGVAFHCGPSDAEMSKEFLGKPLKVQLTLMFWPGLKYEKIQDGATFTIREGGKIVGFGRVLKTPIGLKSTS